MRCKLLSLAPDVEFVDFHAKFAHPWNSRKPNLAPRHEMFETYEFTKRIRYEIMSWVPEVEFLDLCQNLRNLDHPRSLIGAQSGSTA
jgi:hypothetical protein